MSERCENTFCLRSLLEGPGWNEMSDKEQQELLETSTCALLGASKTLLDFRTIRENPEKMALAVEKCGKNLLPKAIVENTKPYKSNGKLKVQTFEI